MVVIRRPINFVLETGSLAGGVRVIGEMANRLAARGHTVAIWSINKRDTMSWFDLDKRVKWHAFLRTGTVADYDQLVSVLAKQSGLKIATFWRTAYAVQAAMKDDEGCYLIQDVETSYTSQPVVAQAVMDTYTMGLRMFTTSRWVESQLPDVAHVGIGIESFWSTDPDARRSTYALACARRQSLKGWSELAETARYLEAAGRPIVTFGMDKELRLSANHRHNPDPKTMVPGKFLTDKQLRHHYSQAGVFVSTSRHEGFSLTPLEAMACSCPVVTTMANGNAEYAEHGVNCLIGGTPRELADAVLLLNRDKQLGVRLAEAGRHTAKRYTWPGVINSLEKFLGT